MKIKFIAIIFTILLLTPLTNVHAQTPATIDGNATRQRIDGFGASTAFQTVFLNNLSATVKSNLYDLLFSPTAGIGLSIVRNELHPGILPSAGNYNWNVSEDVALRQILQEAKNRGVNMFYWVPWTPPAWMKTNNSLVNGGELLPQYYQAYADMISTYIRQYKNQYGIDTYAFSIQNEPDYTATYRSARWSGQQIKDFIKNNLYPTLNRDGVSTRIMAAEKTGWLEGPATDTLTDPVTSPMLTIVASHKYAGSYNLFPNATALGKSVWQTEHSNLSANDPSIGNGLYWAREIHSALVYGNVNAWFYWWLAANDSWGQQLINISSSNINPNKRFYTMGNFSKFVRPGYHRIEAPVSPVGNVNLTAFRAPNTNAVVVVAINSGSVAAPLNINLTNVNISSMTPFITSGTLNLAAQSAIPVTDGLFSYTLPATSVTSFVSPEALIPINFPLPTIPPYVTPPPLPSGFPTPTGATNPPKGTPRPTLTPIPTPSPTTTPTIPPNTGDVNGDGIINNLDVAVVITNYGNAVCGVDQGDIDGNCRIDLYDLNIIYTNFGH